MFTFINFSVQSLSKQTAYWEFGQQWYISKLDPHCPPVFPPFMINEDSHLTRVLKGEGQKVWVSFGILTSRGISNYLLFCLEVSHLMRDLKREGKIVWDNISAQRQLRGGPYMSLVGGGVVSQEVCPCNLNKALLAWFPFPYALSSFVWERGFCGDIRNTPYSEVSAVHLWRGQTQEIKNASEGIVM